MTITVRTFKYDGREHRRWLAELARVEGTLVVLDARFEEEIEHPLLGTIVPQTLSTEYYWLDRWYNVFRFAHPTGELRNYYCNINVPPVLLGNVLSYIDLDVDILVAPDLSYTILDEDEFAANAERFKYPEELRRRSREAVDELVALIEREAFPFTKFK